MWRSALASFASAATQKSTPPALRVATTLPHPKTKTLKNISSASQPLAGTFSSSSELLQTAEEDLAFVVNQAQLQDALQRKPRFHRNVLVSSTQQATPNDALHSVAALLSAGKADDVAHIMMTWAGTAQRLSLSQRVRITKRLGRSIASLSQLRDAATLRSFLAILTNANLYAPGGVPGRQPTLLSALGKKRVLLAQMQATASLCQLSEADGVSIMEKLYWIERCASPATVRGKDCLLVPFSLYTIMREITEADSQGTIDGPGDGLQELAPQLFAHVVSPFQADLASLLALPRSELMTTCQSPECIAPLATAETATRATDRFLRRVVATSEPLQAQQRNVALLRAMAHRRAPAVSRSRSSRSLPPPEATARHELIKAIRGSHRNARRGASERDVCVRIIANPQLMTALNLSPTVVLASYLRAFYSVGPVSPVVAKTSAAVVPRLCSRRLYETAAYVSWNHLSNSCDSVDKVFRKNPRLLDLSVGAVSRVMQKNIKNGTGGKWMGHRSIALLQAAVRATPVTPMHCIPICAGAVDLGVHYASVEEALNGIFPGDKATAEWTLDMVRLCASNQSKDGQTTVQRFATGPSVSRVLHSLVRSASQMMKPKSARGCVVPVPSRSKQLALWQSVLTPTQSPVLRSLMLSLFASEAARRHLRDGTLLLPNELDVDGGTSWEARSEKPLEQLMTWEVLASIATNCTSEALYNEMVMALTNRHMTVRDSFVTGRQQSYCLGDEEKMRKLVLSERDEEHRGSHAHPLV